MTALTKMPSRIGGVVLVAAAVGLTAGLAPASGAPAPNGSILTIEQDPTNPERYLLAMQGTFPMGEYEAHGFINNINSGKYPGGLVFHLYGDDEGDERGNYLIPHRFYPGAGHEPKGYLYAAAEGIRYRRTITVPKYALDEDDGVDEIYAEAKFLDANSEVRGQQFSSVVAREF
jgi:hypothetical protein